MGQAQSRLIQRVKAEVRLLPLVQERVELTRKGRRWYGLCPFHAENTPSFLVDENDRWHCFGCGARGDVVDFVARTRHLSVGAAARVLAREHGLDGPPGRRLVAVPEAPSIADANADERDRRRAEFEALVTRWRADTQRVTALVRRAHAVGEINADPVWDALADAYRRRDDTRQVIAEYWVKPGMMARRDFLAALGDCNGELPDPAEMQVHMQRAGEP